MKRLEREVYMVLELLGHGAVEIYDIFESRSDAVKDRDRRNGERGGTRFIYISKTLHLKKGGGKL